MPLLAVLCGIGIVVFASFAIIFGWQSVGGRSAFDLIAMLSVPPGVLALAWSLEWLGEWRWRKRQMHHEAAFAQLMSRRDDGLTEFQHRALIAAAHVVPATSFRRVRYEEKDGEVLVAPLGSAGAELRLYPFDATIRYGRKQSSFGAPGYQTPEDLIAAFVNECQVHTSACTPLS